MSNDPNLRELGTWYSRNAREVGIATHAYYELEKFRGDWIVDPALLRCRGIDFLIPEYFGGRDM